ncbi:MAG: LysE family translocator [Paracoccaceae bacterium]|nr:LysE family translocator [Paracoccaceae bacterium]
MSFEAWTVFATFWVVFVTTPGPNAVNCIENGMKHGLPRAFWGVAGILTQATCFLILSAFGITGLLAASPASLGVMRLVGAGVLIWLGVRGLLQAGRPVVSGSKGGGTIYLRALLIATVNAKTVAGYLAAFTQFVQPDVEIWVQMRVILPTALAITTLSYTSYTALGFLLGRSALGLAMNVWFRRLMAICFIGYGVALILTGGLGAVVST